MGEVPLHSLAQDGNWLKLVKPQDGDNFKEQMFTEHCLSHFQVQGYLAHKTQPHPL